MPQVSVDSREKTSRSSLRTSACSAIASATMSCAPAQASSADPGTAFFADGFGAGSMRLSFCFPTPERIREGVRRLAGVLEAEMELRETFGANVPLHARGGYDAPNSGYDAPSTDLS